jgi:tetratricopeptide (TPR) repeat protein
MKKQYINRGFLIIALLCCSMFITCDKDRLDTPPLGLTEESYFTSEAEFRLALLNGYAKLTDWYWYHGGSGAILHRLWHLPGDDITEEAGSFSTFELFSGITPTNGFVTEFFDKTYEMLQRVNLIVEKSGTVDRSQFEDDSFVDLNRGEALFLRALANFKLWNMYGTAPLITERLGSDNLNTPRSEGTQMLDQVISDLQEAATLLPASWDAANAGRAFKASAYGLLVKALVFRGNYSGNGGDYSAAVQAYNNITGRALTASYTDNFNALTENNEESIFEYQASKAPGLDNVWLYNDGPWRGVETMSTYWGFYTVANNPARDNFGGTTWRVTRKVFDAHGSDPRIAFFTEDDRSFTKYGKEGLDQLSEGFLPASQNNPRIIRYADVKLLAAEAMARSGNSSQAIALINEVRTRARDWALAEGIADGTVPANRDESETNTSTIMQWIMTERLIELCGEEDHRWFDLKRWDASGDISISGWTGDDNGFSTDLSANFQFEYPKHLLLPIPQTEVERNSAITGNNPGY